MNRGITVVVVILAVLLSTQQAGAQTPEPLSGDDCQSNLVVSTPDFPPVPTEAPPTPTQRSDGTDPSGVLASPTVEAVVPASDEIAGEVEAVAVSLAACISAGNTSAVVELTSAEYRGDLYGGGERLSVEEYEEIAAEGPLVPTRVVAVENVMVNGTQTVRADVTIVRGNQILLEQWTFLYRDLTAISGTPVPAGQGAWRAHRLSPLGTPELDSAETLAATLTEYVIALDGNRVAGPNVIINGVNNGSESHEMLVIRLESGAQVSDLVRSVDGSMPAGIAVIGQLTLLPRESGSVALVDLEPGSYAIVCLLPDSSGVPHISYGQQVGFTVTQQ